MQLFILTPSSNDGLDWAPRFKTLAALLGTRGIEARAAPWTELDRLGNAPTAALLAWGYHLAPTTWMTLLKARAAIGRMLNRPDLMLWNSNKKYLSAIGAAAPIVPTVFEAHLTAVSLGAACERLRSNDVVVKPVIGASAYGVTRMPVATDPDLRDVMLQPYIPTIATEGEISLIYFSGEFSHAVRKLPKRNDYRVQSEYGGVVESLEADKRMRAVAEAALTAAPSNADYARVDLVRWRGDWTVMELELIEPELFLELAPDGGKAFADMIEERLKSFKSAC